MKPGHRHLTPFPGLTPLLGLLTLGAGLAALALGAWELFETRLLGVPDNAPLRRLHLTRGFGLAAIMMIWGTFAMWRVGRRQQAMLKHTLETRTHALAEERAFSEALLENSRDAFLAWNGEGVIQHASPSAGRMFGWQTDALRGRALRTLLDPGHHTDYDRRLKIAQSSGVPPNLGRTLTVKGRRRNGTSFLFEMVPHEATVKRQRVVAAMLRDVTERVRSEQARRRSESLRAVLEELPDAVMVHSDEQLVYANRRFLEVLGFVRPDEVLDRPIRDFVHPDDWERVKARLNQLDATQKPPERSEERFRGPGHDCVTLEVARVPVIFDGRPAVVAIGRDLSKQALAEQRFRQAVESAPSGMVMTDASGCIVLVNRQVELLFGYTESELLGEPIEILVPARFRKLHPALRSTYFGQSVARPMGAGRDLFGLCKDGSEIPVEIALNPLQTDEGFFVLSSIVDISERKKADLLINLADRLAAVGTLAAGVAHGINNPLAYVKGNVLFATTELEELTSSGPGETAERLAEVCVALEQAAEGADRIRDTVSDLLTFARHEHSVEHESADLHAVLDSVVQMTSNEIRHRASLEKQYGNVPPVAGDSSRLAHAFTNLLVNAAHSLPEGAANRNTVRITTRTDATDGFAVVEILDTGCGMPEEILHRVFEPFFTTKPVGAGTGLGLCVTHGIVTGLGGRIEIESSPSSGTVVRVSLPPGPQPRQESANASLRAAVRERRRVLVVDDEPRVLEMARRLLRHHDIVTARDGREALDLIRAGQRFEVIFCDLIMPERTGAQLYDALRAEHPDQARRMVFMTGGAFTSESNDFLERVPNRRLHKPVEPEELEEAIESVSS